MCAEHDTVTLTAPIPLKNTWDIPEGSPLRQAGKPGEGLLPGDVGVIVSVYAGGEAFAVEFLEADSNGRPVAIATVYPYQMRPATEQDLASDRFWQKTLV